MSSDRPARSERQLILLSAGTRTRRESMGARAQALAADVDWLRLTETLRRRRLLPTLGPRVTELAGERTNERFAIAVHDAVAAAQRHGTYLHLVARRLQAALGKAGIRSAELKGSALAEAIYGDMGRRVSNDIDLLLAPQDIADAIEIVRELGYGAPSDHVDERGLPRLHFVLAHEHNELPPIELHWRVHWYEERFATEQLLPPRAVSGPVRWRPAPAAELASLLLFYARDGFIDLRIASDLSAWWDRYRAAMPPDGLSGVLHDYPALAPVLNAGLKVTESVVGLPARAIRGEPTELCARERAAARLANPNPDASASQLYAEMGLIDGLLSPPGGFGGFVRRQLLLPREVLDQRARRSPEKQTRSSVAYAARVAIRCGVVARYARALTRIAVGPESLVADGLRNASPEEPRRSAARVGSASPSGGARR